MTIRELHHHFEQWANARFAESYDNVGLLVGEYATEIKGALVSLDITEAVLEEAEQQGCNLIIAHHPIWFRPRARLNGEDYVSRILLKAIRKNISLYALHTNLDNVSYGVNYKIASLLKMQNLKFIKPHPTLEIGAGLMGDLETPMPIQPFLDLLKKTFKVPFLRYAKAENKPLIQRIGVCGGAGSFLIPEVLQHRLDAFITADITYHKFFDNENQFYLIDIGHFESEQYTTEIILEFLQKIANFAVCLSKVRTNPVYYH